MRLGFKRSAGREIPTALPGLPGHLPLTEALVAIAAGIILFFVLAYIESATLMDSKFSAILEEAAKAATILGFGLWGLAAARVAAAWETRRPRLIRLLRLASSRAASLGLVATSIFAAVENIAYFLAFPEGGIFERLAWSLPVHIAAAACEAAGCILLFRVLASWKLPASHDLPPSRNLPASLDLPASRSIPAATKDASALKNKPEHPSKTRIEKGSGLSKAIFIWLACFTAGCLWHLAANVLAELGAARRLLAIGASASLAIALFAFWQFLERSYIGGFIDGED